MFFDEFIALFSNVQILPLILIIVGFIMLILELFFISGFGFFGVVGILSLLGALISHVIITNNWTQFFILLFILVLSVALLFSIFVFSAKRGLISKSPLVLRGASVPKEYFEKTEKEIQGLLGKKGVCISKVNPVGVMLIDGKEYEVTARTGLIDMDSNAKVVSVEKSKIIVEKCD